MYKLDAGHRIAELSLKHQYGDLYRGPEPEAQALIQCDCRVVGHPCVKEWLVAALLDGVRDDRREPSGQAAPSEVRMRAHAADFREAWEAHPLPCHRGQAPVDTDADEVAHGVSARQERTRFGQLRQSDHFRCIGITELNDGVVAGLGRNGTRREHLHALGCSRGHQTVRDADRRDLQHKDGLAFEDQSAQRCETGETVVACSGEHVDVPTEALGEITAFGEVRCMPQRSPYRPVEVVHRKDLLRNGVDGADEAAAARCSNGICSRATSSAESWSSRDRFSGLQACATAPSMTGHTALLACRTSSRPLRLSRMRRARRSAATRVDSTSPFDSRPSRERLTTGWLTPTA